MGIIDKVKKDILILFLVLIIVFIITYSLETISALDEVQDDYWNETYVSFKDDIIRNPSLNTMELNYTSPVVEDFTVFNEVDPSPEKITIDSATKVRWTQMDRNTERRIYKTYGVGYFTDFIHQFDLTFTNIEAGDADARLIMVAWQLNLVAHSGDDSIHTYPKQNDAVDNEFFLVFLQRDGGVNEFVYFFTNKMFTGITYYITISRTGTTCRMKVHSDSDRTMLIEDSGNQVGINEAYTHVSVSKGNDYDNDPNDHSTGYIENLLLESTSGYSNNGYFTTIEMLSNINGSSIVVLLNTSIPEDDIMTAEFSSNGFDWKDHNGDVGSDTVIEGFEAIDVRDLFYSTFHVRLNYTDGGADSTPRIYQLRIITSGEGNGVTTTTLVIIPLIVVGLIIGLIIGILLKN